MDEQVTRSVDLDAAVDDVWQAVADPAERVQWLDDEDARSRHVRVDEAAPGERLVWTWWRPGDEGDASTVSVVLAPLDGGRTGWLSPSAWARSTASASVRVGFRARTNAGSRSLPPGPGPAPCGPPGWWASRPTCSWAPRPVSPSPERASEPPDAVFAALADGTRRQVLRAVAEAGPVTATALAGELPVTARPWPSTSACCGRPVWSRPSARAARPGSWPAPSRSTTWPPGRREAGRRWDDRLARLADHLRDRRAPDRGLRTAELRRPAPPDSAPTGVASTPWHRRRRPRSSPPTSPAASAAASCSACSASAPSGVVFGDAIQARVERALRPITQNDPTGLTSFVPTAGRFRIYSVTGHLPERSTDEYRLTVDGMVDAPARAQLRRPHGAARRPSSRSTSSASPAGGSTTSTGRA